MDKNNKDPLYSDSYQTTDFVWGQTLGEGKSITLLILGLHSSLRFPTVLKKGVKDK